MGRIRRREGQQYQVEMGSAGDDESVMVSSIQVMLDQGLSLAVAFSESS